MLLEERMFEPILNLWVPDLKTKCALTLVEAVKSAGIALCNISIEEKEEVGFKKVTLLLSLPNNYSTRSKPNH